MATTTTHKDRLIAQQELVADEMRQMNAAVKQRDNKTFTTEEEQRYAALKKQLEGFDARIAQAESDENMMTKYDQIASGAATRSSGQGGRDSFARQLAQTAFGKFLTENRGRLSASGPGWTTPKLSLIAFEGGADLFAIDETPGSGGALVLPDYVEGIVPLPTRPLVVADLLGTGTTDSNSVTYMAEKTITNAAAVVAPGGLKPQSDIVFEAKNEPVKKIATWIEIVRELLDDVPGLAAYLNTRLMHFVRLTEDMQLLNGDGTGENFTGILHRAGLAAPIARTGTENNADAILRQISAIEIATQEVVSGIVMNPGNWNAVLLLKDTTGNYIASGGPFGTPQRKVLWGRDVAVTPAQAVGTAAVGAFKTASAFRRRTPIEVLSSNSHSDFFVRNKLAVLAEERGALCVYREPAFGLVTALTDVVPPV